MLVVEIDQKASDLRVGNAMTIVRFSKGETVAEVKASPMRSRSLAPDIKRTSTLPNRIEVKNPIQPTYDLLLLNLYQRRIYLMQPHYYLLLIHLYHLQELLQRSDSIEATYF